MSELKGGPFCGASTNRKNSEIRIRFQNPNPERKNERLTSVYSRGASGDYYYGRTLLSVAPIKDSNYLVLEGAPVKFMEIQDEQGQKPIPLRVWVCEGLTT